MIDFFTKQEKILILFLIIGLIAGVGVKLYHNHITPIPDILLESDKNLSEFENQLIHKVASLDSIKKTSEIKASNNSPLIKKEKVKIEKASSVKKIEVLEKSSININTATIEELIKLPQVGVVTAQRIIEYRTKNGPFKKIDDLEKVKGIGIKKMQKIEPFIFVDTN